MADAGLSGERKNKEGGRLCIHVHVVTYSKGRKISARRVLLHVTLLYFEWVREGTSHAV